MTRVRVSLSVCLSLYVFKSPAQFLARVLSRSGKGTTGQAQDPAAFIYWVLEMYPLTGKGGGATVENTCQYLSYIIEYVN